MTTTSPNESSTVWWMFGPVLIRFCRNEHATEKRFHQARQWGQWERQDTCSKQTDSKTVWPCCCCCCCWCWTSMNCCLAFVCLWLFFWGLRNWECGTCQGFAFSDATCCQLQSCQLQERTDVDDCELCNSFRLRHLPLDNNSDGFWTVFCGTHLPSNQIKCCHWLWCLQRDLNLCSDDAHSQTEPHFQNLFLDCNRGLSIRKKMQRLEPRIQELWNQQGRVDTFLTIFNATFNGVIKSCSSGLSPSIFKVNKEMHCQSLSTESSSAHDNLLSPCRICFAAWATKLAVMCLLSSTISCPSLKSSNTNVVISRLFQSWNVQPIATPQSRDHVSSQQSSLTTNVSCWLNVQLSNKAMDQTHVTNVNSPFLHTSTPICCQLWHDRRVRRAPHHMFWSFHQNENCQCKIVFSACVNCNRLSNLTRKGQKGVMSSVLVFFTAMCTDFPTPELKSAVNCKPRSALNKNWQCQTFFSTCINCNLLSTLTWKKGWKGVLSSVLAFFTLMHPDFPFLNWSLQQVVNQDLHGMKIVNIKLPFLHASSTIGCHLWPERRARRVSCPVFFFHQCLAQFWNEVSSKLSTKICMKKKLSTSNCLFCMHQPQHVVTSDMKEGSEGCPVLCFGLFHQCVAQFPHFWTEVSSQLSTKICTEWKCLLSNHLFCMHQLESVVNSDLKEGSERCPVLRCDLC